MSTAIFTAQAPTATGRKISGYALKFNKRSRNLGTADAPWFEELSPGCLPPLEKQFVLALIDHDKGKLLARSKYGQGSLKLTVDSVGLKYEFEAPATTAGNDILESIRRGDIDESSFSFTIGKDEWRNEKGVRVRRVLKIEALHDISIVSMAAYADTPVGARARTPAAPPPAPFDEVEHAAAQLAILHRRLNLLAHGI